MKANSDDGRRPPRRSLIPLTIAALVALAVLLGLGTWQVERLGWKEDLIARVNARITAEPGPIPGYDAWDDLDPVAIEYQPVTFEGRYDHSREIHVFIALTQPKGPVGGQGYFVLTPAETREGLWVFVNRGFVPLDRKDPTSRAEGQVEGFHTITGLTRPPEEPSWVSPEDDVERNIWFVRDPERMADAVGLYPDRVAPFTVDVFAGESPGGLPQGGETVIAFSNNHLQYAITWYGLALALVVVFVAVVRRQLGNRQ
ncbi:SURF1 family protein [Mongoliimonas terrestris]|uniref:SURF1 family protein n=1 Tax=Mongoliimonas terrestris TaxID=1709001 RepID=UPI000949A90C|nr:SURF1 family protein [Mongoliimonas terrestris]